MHPLQRHPPVSSAQFFLGPFPHSGPGKELGSKYRYGPTLVLAAAIIGAVRLAMEDISARSTRVAAGIGNSVQLAKGVVDIVRKRFPDA